MRDPLGEHLHVGPNGPIRGPAPHVPREIKPVDFTLQFQVDPAKPNGTANKWKMNEICDGRAPVFDHGLYLPKWMRRCGNRDAVPFRVEIKLHIEYCQSDPGGRPA